MGYMNKSLVLAGLNLRLLRLKNEHENVDKIAELENIIGAISETETEDVIERSKIDKAIEEMERYSTSFDFVKRHDLANAVDNCIGMIQRNIGE